MNIKLTQRTDYINGMEVTPSALTTVVHLAGGRLVKQVSGTWDPQYYYTDHRGDIRVVYHANATTSTAEMVQEDHLTPFGVQMVGLSRTNWPGWESHQNRGDDQYYSDGWNRFEAAILCGWSEERANAYASGYSRTIGGASGAMGGGSAGAGGASGGKGSGGFGPSANDETNPEGEKDKGKSSGDGDGGIQYSVKVSIGPQIGFVEKTAGTGGAFLNIGSVTLFGVNNDDLYTVLDYTEIVQSIDIGIPCTPVGGSFDHIAIKDGYRITFDESNFTSNVTMMGTNFEFGAKGMSISVQYKIAFLLGFEFRISYSTLWGN